MSSGTCADGEVAPPDEKDDDPDQFDAESDFDIDALFEDL